MLDFNLQLFLLVCRLPVSFLKECALRNTHVVAVCVCVEHGGVLNVAVLVSLLL